MIVLLIATVALFPGFFATQRPQESDGAEGSFIPVQRVHFWDDGPALFVYGVRGARIPSTLRMEWQIDESSEDPAAPARARLRVAGAVADPDRQPPDGGPIRPRGRRSICSAPIAWAAISGRG